MDISSLSTATLRNLISLVEKRDALLSELTKIDADISAAYSGGSTTSTASGKRRGRKPGRKAKAVAPVQPAEVAVKAKAAKPDKKARKARKGGIKESIVAALKEAGANGISVKDLSAKLGLKPQNVHVWFATTGKKAGAVKASPGIYRLKA